VQSQASTCTERSGAFLGTVIDRHTDSWFRENEGLYPQSMERFEKRLITVRQGNVRPTGSWLYVWVDTADGAMAYRCHRL
jgi:hypothetical protein